MGRFLCGISRTLVVALAGFTACGVDAAADRFDYDAAGRLIRRVDDQSRSNDYLYDPAGNVLQVTAPGQATAPTIASGPLADQRRNEVRQVSVGGSGLGGVVIRPSHPGIVISQLASTATAASFRLAVSNQVPLGSQQLTFQSSAGSVSLPFNVFPAVGFSFVPEPISVAPDNIARKFSLFISEPYAEAKTFSLSTISPNIAKLSVTQINLPAGQIQANLGVIGVALGTTLLRVINTGLNEPMESIVFVGDGGANRLVSARSVAITRTLPWLIAPSITAGLSVGIVRGQPGVTASAAGTAVGAKIGIVRGTPAISASAAGTTVASNVAISRGTPGLSMNAAGMAVGANVGVIRN